MDTDDYKNDDYEIGNYEIDDYENDNYTMGSKSLDTDFDIMDSLGLGLGSMTDTTRILKDSSDEASDEDLDDNESWWDDELDLVHLMAVAMGKDSEAQKKRRAERGPKQDRKPGESRFMRYVKRAEKHRATKDDIWDVSTYNGRQFRRRFRVPYVMFEQLVLDFEGEADRRQSHDLWGNPKSDTRLLVLAALRVLAHSFTFDLCYEMTDVSAGTHAKFFKVFVEWLGTTEYDRCVQMPKSEQEIAHVMNNYAMHGVPGCIGSIDAVHIAWDLCPAGLRNDCKGKEEYPTLAFQVAVSHTQKILGVSGPYYRTWNDKTIARHDENVAMFREAPYNQVEWSFNTINGDDATDHGAYMICDGGYHLWPVFVCPFKDQPDGTILKSWSGLIESLRKDVECTFVILKKRFMFLKTAVRLRSIDSIGDAFRACCALHNKLLVWDGRDNWKKPLDEKEIKVDDSIHQFKPQDMSFIREEHYSNGEDKILDSWNQETFHARRAKLVDHYSFHTYK